MATQRTKINGNALRSAIFNKGMTLTEAAQKVGIGKSSMSNWTVQNEMPTRILNPIKEILDIPLEQFVCAGEPIKTEEKSVRREIIQRNPSKYATIDGEKLREAITSRDIKLTKIGETIGLGESSIYHYIRGNYIPHSIAMLLDKVHGISLSEYEYVEPAKEETPAEDNKADISALEMNKPLTKNDLYTIIYGAVYAACIELIGKVKMND